MGRTYIDRERLEVVGYQGVPEGYENTFDCGVMWLLEQIDEMPSADVQPVQRWIPCSERMPSKQRKTYWCCEETGYQFQCRWTNNIFGLGESDRWGWSIFDVPQYSHVIAWMPLPQPYRGEQDE